MQGNGDLVFCKMQAFRSSNVKMDNLLEMLAGATRIFKISIINFISIHIQVSICFYFYFRICKTLVFQLYSELWVQSLCIPDGQQRLCIPKRWKTLQKSSMGLLGWFWFLRDTSISFLSALRACVSTARTKLFFLSRSRPIMYSAQSRLIF